jgi:hypothetical protein
LRRLLSGGNSGNSKEKSPPERNIWSVPPQADAFNASFIAYIFTRVAFISKHDIPTIPNGVRQSKKIKRQTAQVYNLMFACIRFSLSPRGKFAFSYLGREKIKPPLLETFHIAKINLESLTRKKVW